MTTQTLSTPLSFVGNGSDRPVHHDRQVLRAGDLALEQATQDAMLARARRYLHGWGIVAGFVPQVTEDHELVIGPGYGVTPSGAELWMPQSTSLADAAARVLACCGPDSPGCEELDERGAVVGPEVGTAAGWLIARPASRPAEPRSGVPEGCEHPATTLLPSRSCGGIEFAILCELPATHQPHTVACSTIDPFICAVPDGPEPPPLPWEVAASVADDLLVVARLVVDDGSLGAGLSGRRNLLPVSLIQDWLTSCVCPRLAALSPIPPIVEPVPPVDPLPPIFEPFPPIVVEPLPPVLEPLPPIVVEPFPPIVVEPLPPILEPLPPIVGPVPPILEPLPPIVGPVPPILEPLPPIVGPVPPILAPGLVLLLGQPTTTIPGVGAARATALNGIGVASEGAFLVADDTRLASTMGVSVGRVQDMKNGIADRHGLDVHWG
jgi:hypothetical protein